MDPVWPDLAKFHHYDKYLKIFGNIFKVYLVLGKVSNLLWRNLWAIGQFFVTEKGQILTTKFGHLVTLGIDLFVEMSDSWKFSVSS